MPERRFEAFPLFPLGIVALPSEAVPLHIFEQRYRTMIEACIAAEPDAPEREFGVLWLSDDALNEVGCACEIAEVLERQDDGAFDILARGTRPFRLIERRDDLPYPAGSIEFLVDVEEPHDADAARAAHELYRVLVAQATDREIDGEELERLDAYAMAGTVEFELDAKQELLELRSESARLRLLARLLGSAIERLDTIDRARARALSNGKVRFG